MKKFVVYNGYRIYTEPYFRVKSYVLRKFTTREEAEDFAKSCKPDIEIINDTIYLCPICDNDHIYAMDAFKCCSIKQCNFLIEELTEKIRTCQNQDDKAKLMYDLTVTEARLDLWSSRKADV